MKNKHHKYILKAFLESSIPMVMRRSCPELMIIDSIIGGYCEQLVKRAKVHEANPAREGLKLEVIQPNLNYVQARVVEQDDMAYYHTINTANKMNNQINGISPLNPKLGIYKEAAVGMLGYTWNQVSNEILYWTGN